MYIKLKSYKRLSDLATKKYKNCYVAKNSINKVKMQRIN